MLKPELEKPDPKANLRSRRFPLRRMVPNIVTLLALCLGMTALRLGLNGRFDLAMFCIIGAAFLDAFDGRLARLLRAESPFGAQLDSLSDFVNFGIVPVLLVYLYALQATGRLGWAVILLFSVCCALRLARFNVDIDDADRPAWKRKFFTGVPSPSAGALVMLPMFLDAGGIFSFQDQPVLVSANVILVALLMVSNLPTFSGKGLSPTIRRDLVLPLMLGIGFVGVMSFTFPWITLSVLSAIYYAAIPVSALVYRRYAKRGEEA
ncbi:phosphatidylcholine/phosphatidylserine synthase [Alphaproteobacteria bacterium]|nr:phosphatidylcholine/phosphatidylserine synthase [Alphaproteobacteria bacterium]